MSATALSREERAAFYRDILRPQLGRTAFTSMLARRLGLAEVMANPEAAAATHAVFELRQVNDRPGGPRPPH